MADLQRAGSMPKCFKPTIRSFQQPKQSRALLQSWRLAGPNMARRSPTTLWHWQSRWFNPVSPDTPHYETERKRRWRRETDRCLAHHVKENRHKKQREKKRGKVAVCFLAVRWEADTGCSLKQKKQTERRLLLIIKLSPFTQSFSNTHS